MRVGALSDVNVVSDKIVCFRFVFCVVHSRPSIYHEGRGQREEGEMKEGKQPGYSEIPNTAQAVHCLRQSYAGATRT